MGLHPFPFALRLYRFSYRYFLGAQAPIFIPSEKGLGLENDIRNGPIASGNNLYPWEGRRVSVEQKVIEIVCEHLAVNKEQVTRSTNFIEDIGADSLDIVELIMELEEEFDIQIPDDQAEKIKTVGEAIDYIERESKK
jgi:acyl carrier protein